MIRCGVSLNARRNDIVERELRPRGSSDAHDTGEGSGCVYACGVLFGARRN